MDFKKQIMSGLKGHEWLIDGKWMDAQKVARIWFAAHDALLEAAKLTLKNKDKQPESEGFGCKGPKHDDVKYHTHAGRTVICPSCGATGSMNDGYQPYRCGTCKDIVDGKYR